MKKYIKGISTGAATALGVFGLISVSFADSNGGFLDEIGIQGETAEDSHERNRYVGFGILNTEYDDDDGIWGSDIVGESETGITIYQGFRVNDWFSVEGQLNYFGGYESGGADVDAASFMVNGRLGVPLVPFVEPFAKIGIGLGYLGWEMGTRDDSGTGLASSYAAGVQVPFHERLSANVFFQHTSYDIEAGTPSEDYGQEFNSFGASVEYRY